MVLKTSKLVEVEGNCQAELILLSADEFEVVVGLTGVDKLRKISRFNEGNVVNKLILLFLMWLER